MIAIDIAVDNIGLKGITQKTGIACRKISKLLLVFTQFQNEGTHKNLCLYHFKVELELKIVKKNFACDFLVFVF